MTNCNFYLNNFFFKFIRILIKKHEWDYANHGKKSPRIKIDAGGLNSIYAKCMTDRPVYE